MRIGLGSPNRREHRKHQHGPSCDSNPIGMLLYFRSTDTMCCVLLNITFYIIINISIKHIAFDTTGILYQYLVIFLQIFLSSTNFLQTARILFFFLFFFYINIQSDLPNMTSSYKHIEYLG